MIEKGTGDRGRGTRDEKEVEHEPEELSFKHSDL
jgi:hypothetical protein